MPRPRGEDEPMSEPVFPTPLTTKAEALGSALAGDVVQFHEIGTSAWFSPASSSSGSTIISLAKAEMILPKMHQIDWDKVNTLDEIKFILKHTLSVSVSSCSAGYTPLRPYLKDSPK